MSWVVLAALLFTQTQEEVRIDRVIAVVDREVITETELLVEARLALARRGAVKSAAKPIAPRFLEGFLDYLVNQLLVSTQARRVGLIVVSDDDLRAEVDRFAERFGSRAAFEAFLDQFDISTERLRASLRRDLRNGRYVTRRMNVRLMGREVATDSAEYTEALELWLSELRESAEIRLIGSDGRLTLQ